MIGLDGEFAGKLVWRGVRSLRPRAWLGSAWLALLVPSLLFADAAEILLIHQELGKEFSGRRRGNLELMLSPLSEERFVVYDAGGRLDPVGWRVAHESAEEYANAQAGELQARKYDITRTYVLTNVLEGKAFVALVDSGSIIDRASGSQEQYWVNDFWIFQKTDEDWHATALIRDVADSTAGRFSGQSSADADLAEFLGEEAEAWGDGVSSVVSHYDEDLVVVDAYHKVTPASWLIIFSGTDVLDQWLDRRLKLTDYQIERELLHTSIGSSGTEAVAVAREKVTVTHTSGDASHAADRHVLWTVSKRSGDWKITNLFWHLRRPD